MVTNRSKAFQDIHHNLTRRNRHTCDLPNIPNFAEELTELFYREHIFLLRIDFEIFCL